MVLGARQIGTRTLGDSTGDTNTALVEYQFGQVLYAGVGAAFFLSSTPQRGAVVLVGTGTFIAPPGEQQQTAVVRFEGVGFTRFYVPLVKVVDPSIGPEPYRLIVADVNGVRYGELENVKIDSASWVLNGTGTLSFKVGADDAKGLLVQTPTREVQLYRGVQKLWEGPVVRKRVNKSQVEAQAADTNWYFTKRFVGKADRQNYIGGNNGFEQGLLGWDILFSPIATAAQAYPRNVTISKTNKFTGERSARMQHSQVDPSVFLRKLNVWSVPTDDVDGTLWTATAWFYIESWSGPPLGGHGFSIARYSTTQTIPIFTPVYGTTLNYPKPLGGGAVTFDADTPRGQWTRVEIPLLQPPRGGANEFVTVNCAGIRGTIYWDEVSLTRNEALRFNNVDQVLIAKGLVEHAQDPAYGKSDLNIGTNCQPSGIRRSRIYEHSEHQMIADTLGEFPSLANGFDHSIEIADNGTRTFTTHFPYKGYKRNDIILEYGKNLLDYTETEDGEVAANSVVVLGEGEGSDREEGGYADPSSLGGLVLEKVYNGTTGAPIQTLQDQARRGVERFKTALVIPELTTKDPDLISTLKTGDIVRVKLKLGENVYDDWVRIIQMTLTPDSDTMTIQVNPLTQEQITLA